MISSRNDIICICVIHTLETFLSYGVILNVHISLKHERFLQYWSELKIQGIRNIYIVYYAQKDHFSAFK